MVDSISTEEYLASTGTEYGPGEWFKVDQERINNFAEATGDFQFIHVDPEKAKETPFGGTIAHGFLSLSLLAKLVPEIVPRPADAKMGVNYGMNKLRFLAPVKEGAEVRAKCKIIDITEKRPGQVLVTNQVTLEIKGEETPALITEWLSMVFLAD